ncbi:MAG: SMEK domain-containing protein, partial [bacterium]|nr:SMEK domain-containing protein [bacterium]
MREFEELNRVLNLISLWLTSIKSHNAVGYFDINKVAEGVALRLLNETYGYCLENLNFQQNNYPGVDLGDKSKKIAFQITSRKDLSKLQDSLEKFTRGPDKIYTGGIRFLILSLEKKPVLSQNKYKAIYPGFDPEKHIIMGNELLTEIHRLYDSDRESFNRVKDILETEIAGITLKKESVRQVPLAQSKPGLIRYFLDRWVPHIHSWLTTRTGFLKQPAEWAVLNAHLRTLSSTITDDIEEKTYVLPATRDLPDEADRIKIKRRGFMSPIHQLIKEITGVSRGGGDAQSARISAAGKKSRVVRNIVKRLLEAKEPLILLGDPGTGKSITLQHAAVLFAGLESKRMYPTICLFIRLGEFRVPGHPDCSAVWNFVKASTPLEVRPYIDSLRDSGRLVIFFDGMDEMSRERYSEHTAALSVFAGSMKGITRTLFSCRVTDFTPRFRHNRLVLLPFGRGHIHRYLKRQIPQFPLQIGDRVWSARRLAKRLVRGDLPMQADNPFVLWLLCTFLQEEEEWPESRVHLLEYYNKYNYRRKSADVLNIQVPDMDSAFLTWSRIAYEITCRNKGTAIPVDDVRAFLEPHQQGAVEAGFLCGVLQKSLDLESELLRFEHHRFQEYFTAYFFKHNSEETAHLDWLDKLDSPRWQETLFNLVLMGAGHEALEALGQAISQGIYEFIRFRDSGKKTDAVRVETQTADRIELASRVFQQVGNQRGEDFSKLFEPFRKALYQLADVGNPISRVKMMWASGIVSGVDVFRAARYSLVSPVAWVRRQALVITAAVKDVEGGALQEDILHGFASGLFLNRLNGYVRIASALKQKRLWCVLATGFLLYMLQLFLGFGIVYTARNIALPVFTTETAYLEELSGWIVSAQETDALKNNDMAAIEQKREFRKDNAKRLARLDSMLSRVRQVYDSRWFLFTIIGTMLVTLLYSMQRLPGRHFLLAQSVGFFFLALPFIWIP